MSIRVALNHVTHYKYDRPINLGPQVVRLRPAPHSRTPILAYSLKVLPAKHFVNWMQDPQSNYQARLVFPEMTTEFRVEVDVVAEMTAVNPFDFFLEPEAMNYPFKYDHSLDKELKPFLETIPFTPKLKAWVDTISRREMRTIDFLVGINQRLSQEIKYLIRLEPGVQTPEETLTKKSGSCRDSAWLLVQILRNMGLAARFASGYLIQLVADVKSLDGPSGTEVDFTDLHAWTEVYLPGAGWVGLDPTSGLLTGEGHIPLACTPEPGSAAPISGALDECESTLHHEMKVTRVHEDPRVTKPYTEEEWKKIEALGHQIDKDLDAGDVRLTMGGEPTFISIDDMDGAEWNTAAVGPNKRKLAGVLIKRLQKQFAPGALLHYGQGKWYPGESLPRWALAAYWRKDGTPIWDNLDLIADENKYYGFGEREAREFTFRLCEHLDVDRKFAMPGYEDAWYYLWKERRLPTNVDPLKSQLKDPEERARLAKIFEQGLDKVAGYALPIRRAWDGNTPVWQSGAWFLRPETMFLIPGDSAMGFRLPIDSQPWVVQTDYPFNNELDPLEDRAPLPDPREKARQMRLAREAFLQRGAPSAGGRSYSDQYGPGGPGGTAGLGREREMIRRLQWPKRTTDAEKKPVKGESAPWIVRTAMCIEPRNGFLHVFMPPVFSLEDYLDLTASIEETAQDLKMPVFLEGYPPPYDSRLDVLKVTPDPGVLEVNIHPSHTWDELVQRTTILYDEARLTRLGTDKFMLDGKHTGTCGGNHIILGGATPKDSPVLRRPDLIKSLIGYWHNHPSLSYLFSGMFLGPTSQAPRIDDARNDQIHELEIAFKEIPNPLPPDVPGGFPRSPNCAPWLIDRILRNILIDVTGNTHRSEFCIDKLYSPDTSSGRLGLVEFRGFEMPPNARMSLAQHVLLRALVARFWKKPYDEHLVRWDTEVHDRHMLPHFVEQDFADVVEECQIFGYPLKTEWFAPHLEFRFPFYGETTIKGVNLELRQAIEPWHVLGEEPGGGGTVRYVDSSVERLQVKVKGMIDSRHVLACNGRAVPLHPTGANGQFVAGVRYRAWAPPACLHPTIGIHTPLVFDMIDKWSKRSIGGMTYHVMHPGGRGHDKFPVNSLEAEGRRIARFQAFGHTPGPMVVPYPETNPYFPFTLDLRR